MNRSMQERFVGTIVVVTLGIVLIPAWLDGPESPVARPRTGDLPGAVQSRTIRLDAEERRPVATPAPIVTVPAASTESPSARPVPPTSAAEEPLVPEAAAVLPPDRAGADEPDRPASEAASSPPPVVPAAAGWAVQVGSFTSTANAERLAASLESSGFPAFVSRHEQGGRTLLRVRAGPEPERSGARALAARLEKAGHKTQIVRQP